MAIFDTRGYPQVDLFATAESKQALEFCSLAGSDLTSLGDTFQISSSGTLFCAFPHFPLLNKVIGKILDDRMDSILLAPFWPHQI